MSIAEKFYTMEYGAAPEDTKEVDHWLDRHHRRFDQFIGGAWVKPAAGEYFATSDPSTGDKIAEVANGNTADVDAAVEAARKALPALAGAQRPPARPLSLRPRAPGAEALAPPRRARDHGQRQAHPREPRHRHSRSSRATSITTPAGRSSSNPSSPATQPAASSARSSPGTSRC